MQTITQVGKLRHCFLGRVGVRIGIAAAHAPQTLGGTDRFSRREKRRTARRNTRRFVRALAKMVAALSQRTSRPRHNGGGRFPPPRKLFDLGGVRDVRPGNSRIARPPSRQRADRFGILGDPVVSSVSSLRGQETIAGDTRRVERSMGNCGGIGRVVRLSRIERGRGRVHAVVIVVVGEKSRSILGRVGIACLDDLGHRTIDTNRILRIDGLAESGARLLSEAFSRAATLVERVVARGIFAQFTGWL